MINDFISSYRDYTPDRFWGHDSPLMLLDGRRVAAAFLHPQESRFGILENSYALSLKFYDIKGSSPLALAYVACTQSKWGKRVIRQINRILKTTNIHEKGIGYYSEWLTDDTRRWYSSRAKNYFTRKVVDHFKLASVQGIILKHRILGTAMAEVAFE